VIDPAQLRRIEAVHRGFLYQHLYAVGCMIKLASLEAGQVAVERDEDIVNNRGQTTFYELTNVVCPRLIVRIEIM